MNGTILLLYIFLIKSYLLKLGKWGYKLRIKTYIYYKVNNIKLKLILVSDLLFSKALWIKLQIKKINIKD